MIILDTHVLLWYLDNPFLCSKKALHAIEMAKQKDGLFVSSMSIWEIALLVERGRIEFNIDPSLWIKKCENLQFLHFIPVDNDIAYHSITLPPPIHRDPVDRIIMATSRIYKGTIISKDEKILSYKHVSSIW